MKLSLESRNKPDYKIAALTENYVKRFGDEFELTVHSLYDSELKGRILLTPDEDDWLGIVEMGTGVNVITVLEVNKRYRGQGIGKTLLEVFDEAEYLFGEEDNARALNMYKKYWHPGVMRWLKFKPRKWWYSFYNPKNVSGLVYVDEKGRHDISMFTGVNIAPNVISGHTMVIGAAFRKVADTGNQNTDYALTTLGNYTKHSERPNMYVLTLDDIIYYATNEEIERGEELTVNHEDLPWNQ